MSHILIIGAGVVGQATGKGFAKKGHTVSYIDVNSNTLAALRNAGLNAMTITEVNWDEVDIVMLTVSTPTVNDRIVLDHLETATAAIGRGLAQAQHFITVVVRSTVPPTTTEERITPLLERMAGKRAGLDFGVAMNPEFLRQVSSEQDFARPWITVLGCNEQRTYEILKQLYAPFGALIVQCTPTEAELAKYVNNVYNAVKISYFNEVHAICEQLGVDSNVVGAIAARSAESMWNPLYGTRGGIPYGGACLPKDTTAFLEFVQTLGMEHFMLEAAIQVNKKLEEQVAAVSSPDKIGAALETTRVFTRTGVYNRQENGYILDLTTADKSQALRHVAVEAMTRAAQFENGD